MDYRIREATPADVDAVFAIWKEGALQSLGTSLPEGVDFRARFHQQVAEQDENFKVFLAEDERGLLGWQALAPFRSNPAVRHLMAESSTYVSAASGKLGVGRDLILHALRHADHSKLQYVVAYVASTNERTLYSAQKAGFHLVGMLPPMHKEPQGPQLAFLVYPCGGWSA